ncbi:MAG: hypothetical protein K6E97_08565 [Treponema sp.]|jgi:hypothetical protein|nr:hypothetical protein [Treponema sp.]
MKKNIKLLISVVSLISLSCYAFAQKAKTSLGGGIGACIEQYNNTRVLIASPTYTLKADFEWEKFGIGAIFDFTTLDFYSSSDTEQKYSDLAEGILFTPFYKFNNSKTLITVGPTFGLTFNQSKNVTDADNSVSYSRGFLTFGATVEFKLSLSNKMDAYFEIPVLYNKINFGYKYKIVSGGAKNETKYDGIMNYDTALYCIPKFGVLFKL